MRPAWGIFLCGGSAKWLPFKFDDYSAFYLNMSICISVWVDRQISMEHQPFKALRSLDQSMTLYIHDYLIIEFVAGWTARCKI